LGLLQKEVAEQLRVDTASICNWESNESQPMVRCLPGIIAFLGHNPLPEADDLIGKFKRERCTLGLTQEQLAQKLGIDESTIAGWERGENTPVGPYLKLLEKFVAGEGFLPKRPGTAAAKGKSSSRGDRTPHGLHRTLLQELSKRIKQTSTSGPTNGAS